VRALLLAAWAGAGAGAGVVDIIKCERAGRGRSLVQAAAGRVFVLRPTSPLHTHTLHAARAAFMTLDLCEAEQSALAREHVLTARLYTDDPHSHAGPRSISPFAPCCASRLPVVYDAARLTRDSVVWDLGCGDGRVLHDAAARYGCRCVGVEIDATCLRRCASRAKSRGPVVENLCRWHLADVTAAPEGVLGRDDALAPGTPAPTVVIVFVTGHGLRAISPWLKREWERAPRPFTIVTCVESLDACVDYRDGVSFDDFDPRAANPDGWEVYRDETHAKYGVFVVPPRCVSVEAWRASRPTPRACGPGSVAADAEPVAVVRNVLTDAECAALHLFAASTGFDGPHRTRTEDEEEEERERGWREGKRAGAGAAFAARARRTTARTARRATTTTTTTTRKNSWR
jgi:SAM-dependent methyltransferase